MEIELSEEWNGDERRQQTSWHVGKEIPIAVLGVLIAQFAGIVWSYAQLTAKIDSAISAVAEFKQERYTKEDGRRDRELLMAFFEQLRQTDREYDRRLTAIEEQSKRDNGRSR